MRKCQSERCLIQTPFSTSFVADIICHDYIDRAMENYVGTMYDFLKEKCKRGTSYLYEKTIVNTIGKENLQELLKADLVSPIMVGNKQAYLL